jgi:hypothetical protein
VARLRGRSPRAAATPPRNVLQGSLSYTTHAFWILIVCRGSILMSRACRTHNEEEAALRLPHRIKAVETTGASEDAYVELPVASKV